MASEETTQGQEVVECGLCHNHVSFFCRRCGINLCDSCLPVHMRVKSKTGHDVVDYISKDDDDDDDACWCDSHPKHECSAFCKTCDVAICPLCVSIKHKSHEMSELHDKIEELLKDITRENDRLQSFRHELKRVLDHTTKLLTFLSSFYQKRKEEVTARGEEWHRLIDSHVKKLHQELDDLKKESEAALQKQMKELEEMIGKFDEMNMKSRKLQESKNVRELQEFRPVIQEQKTVKEFTQYTFPIFHESRIDEKYLQTYFGWIEKILERKISPLEIKSKPETVYGRRMVEVPSVSYVIDTGFYVNEQYNDRLLDMAVTDDRKVWMGGANYQLKLFDLQGNLYCIFNIPCDGMHICFYNKQVVFSDYLNRTVEKISDYGAVTTMFTTGDWIPEGITGSASGDLLVCLNTDDQSKVVRYDSTGTVLQEIQYDSQCQPLYQRAWYITENVNGDIIVTDSEKDEVITVDRLGIFRYTYSGGNDDLGVGSVTTDSVGHVIVTDYNGNKIHMLDRDGRFLRYIIPDERIYDPRAVCMIGDGEMIVGEVVTGLAKRIKLYDEQK